MIVRVPGVITRRSAFMNSKEIEVGFILKLSLMLQTYDVGEIRVD